MTQMTCADAIVDSLLAHGIDTVFGVPGAQIYALFDALGRRGDRINLVTTRHEQAAAYMAFGYARSTGRASAYAVVPGPGVLNTGAALCTAAGCNQPVLCLTGEVPSAFIGQGRGHLHELRDQLGTLRSLAKWGERIDSPGAASLVMAEAFRQMRSARQGPAVAVIPWDVLGSGEDLTMTQPHPQYRPPIPNEASVSALASELTRARRPLIVVGGGALDAGPEIRALAERLGAPVMAFRSGRGIVPADDPLGVSIVEAYELWHETDLLIGIGSRLEVPYLRWSYRPDGMRLIRIDIDPREMLRVVPDAALVTDARQGVALLLDALAHVELLAVDQRPSIAAAKQAAAAKIADIQPHAQYLEAIRSALPRDGFFVEELCQAGYASYFGFPVYAPRTYISCGYQGTLGFGFMTALGVKVANPDKPVVSISGDGGFLFGIQELATAAQYGIGVVAIVFDNSAYGNVRRDQLTQFGGRVFGADLSNPDFLKLAEAFGVQAYSARTPAELQQAVTTALATGGPAVIHVPVDQEVSPWPLIHPPRPRVVA